MGSVKLIFLVFNFVGCFLFCLSSSRVLCVQCSVSLNCPFSRFSLTFIVNKVKSEVYSLYAAEVTIRQYTYSNKMKNKYTKLSKKFQNTRVKSGRRGRDRMVVGFPTTYAIRAYTRSCCEFESNSWWGVQYYVIKFVSDLRQVGGFLLLFRFPPPIKLTSTI